MLLVALLLSLMFTVSDPTPLVETIDFYDPGTGSYKGKEINRYGPDGRRLRWEIYDSEGKNTLLFSITHDSSGRDLSAIYFEDGSEKPSREKFSYSADGRLKTTNYVSRTGDPADRTESDLDEKNREIRKRYFRANGTQYGAEDVLWNADGTKKGWDFKYVGREGGASFRYEYISFDTQKRWIRRIKTRNGEPEAIEVRTLMSESNEEVYRTPSKFGLGIISTGESESSPSFSKDGRTMVFARYGDDWSKKKPYIARLDENTWKSEPIPGVGEVYNLAVSPDGESVFFSKREGESKELFKITKRNDGWSQPDNLTKRFGLAGTYPVLTDEGDLYFFDSEGASGSGVYMSSRTKKGFGKVSPVFVTQDDTLFDPFTTDGKRLIVSRCFDDICNPGPKNGFWEITATGKARKIPNLPYGWGAQIVESLGLFVYTDGQDILAIPLRDSGVSKTAN